MNHQFLDFADGKKHDRNIKAAGELSLVLTTPGPMADTPRPLQTGQSMAQLSKHSQNGNIATE